MLIEIPNLPLVFDWQLVRADLTQWFQQHQRVQAYTPSGVCCLFPNNRFPDGWIAADGTTYEKAKFPALAKALGTEVTPTTFAVPNPGAAPGGFYWMVKV